MFTHFTAFDNPATDLDAQRVCWCSYARPGDLYHLPEFAPRDDGPATSCTSGAGITLLESAAFEMIGINGSLYSYWGPPRVPDLPVPLGDRCARSRPGDLLRGGGNRSCVPAATGQWQLLGMFVLFSVHVFSWPTSGAGWAHHHRNTPRKHVDHRWIAAANVW